MHSKKRERERKKQKKGKKEKKGKSSIFIPMISIFCSDFVLINLIILITFGK